MLSFIQDEYLEFSFIRGDSEAKKDFSNRLRLLSFLLSPFCNFYMQKSIHIISIDSKHFTIVSTFASRSVYLSQHDQKPLHPTL